MSAVINSQDVVQKSVVLRRLTGKVGNGRHDALDNSPAKLTTLQLCRLTDDRAKTVSSDNSPDEEGNASGRCNDRLDCEQVANLVDREPQGRQRAEPEEEEGDEVAGVCAGRDG